MRRLILLAAVATSGCYYVDPVGSSSGASAPSSFRVEVRKVTPAGSTNPLDVLSSCVRRYGSQQAVPESERGTSNCRYAIARGQVELEVVVTALDKPGQQINTFEGPVSFRVVPGDMAEGPTENPYQWRQVVLRGGQGTGRVRATNLYGEVRVWVQDEPPETIYIPDGGMAPPPTQPDGRSFAAGSSAPLFFEEPTLAKVQQPNDFDNRTSPYTGQFIAIGRAPEAGTGQVQVQSCADDPQNDGKPVTMVVTGTDPSGFFVTDITACRVREETGTGSNVRTPEPSGYLPGTYGSLFIYNFSFPEGLDQGDLLWTLAGSVQEFTSTTQFTFPSWTIREKVRLLPPEQWNKYLDLVPPVDLLLRHCGLDDQFDSFVTDTVCGHNRRNLKMESLESRLVKLRRVRMPQTFKSCDLDGDGAVPFFCETTVDGEWVWSGCAFPAPPVDPEATERQCHIDCINGSGPLCSERTAFRNFGQFVVELPGSGPREAGLDDSLPARWQTVPLGTSSARHGTAYSAGRTVNVWCEAAARMKAGSSSVVAGPGDTLVPARTRLSYDFKSGEQYLAFFAEGTPPANSRCHVGESPRTRINVMTRDAAPELEPDCRTEGDDLDAERKRQCRLLREATYDIVGHLRHVQPARPRWLVMPRDADDLCCYPGPSNECPRPIKPCE
jgi:hypothetical protein